jgi:iron-sulfur cluster repair protein YtfE (RIC family)
MLIQFTQRVPVLLKTIASRKLDATELLTQEHIKIESLLIQLRFLNQIAPRLNRRKKDVLKRREAIFEQIQQELSLHIASEEQFFYPECEKHEELKAIAIEAFEEHKQIRTLLDEMKDLGVDNETFHAKLTLLTENLGHHLTHEEEILFPRVQKIFSQSRLERLANQMRAKRQARQAA